MTGESANSQKMWLAAAVAEGTAVAKWAATNEAPKRTAYRRGGVTDRSAWNWYGESCSRGLAPR